MKRLKIFLLLLLPAWAQAQNGQPSTFTDFNIPYPVPLSQIKDSLQKIRDSLQKIQGNLKNYQPLLTADSVLFEMNGQVIKKGSKATFTATAAGSYIATSVNAKEFGAVGDGATISHTQINNALKSGIKEVWLEAGKPFALSAQLKVPLGVTLHGNGAILIPKGALATSGDPVIVTEWNGGDSVHHKATGLNIQLKENLNYFEYANASQLVVGSNVVLLGGFRAEAEGSTPDYNYGHYAPIQRIDGNTVYLAIPFDSTYIIDEIRDYKTSTNVHVDNLTIDLRAAATTDGVTLNHANNSSISNITILASPTTTEGQGVTYVGVSGRIFGCNISGQEFANTSYGVNVAGHNIEVFQNTITQTKHCITTAGRDWMSSGLDFHHNILSNDLSNAAPVDLHANAQNSKIHDNIINCGLASDQAINVRAKGTEVYLNDVTMRHTGTRATRHVILSEMAVKNISVHHNWFRSITLNDSTTSGNGSINVIAGTPDYDIENFDFSYNYCEGIAAVGGKFKGTAKFTHNNFKSKKSHNAGINVNGVAADCIVIIDKNDFELNMTGNSFGYLVSTPVSPKAVFITRNFFRVTDPANTQQLLRINGSRTIADQNVFETNKTDPIYLGATADIPAKEAWLKENFRYDFSGNYYQVMQPVLPTATTWWEGKRVYVGSETDRKEYACKRVGSAPTWVAL
jgi:hypothetical protein